MADIFISYSSKDRAQAEQLTELLASAGLSVWIDQSALAASTSWSAEIVDAIANCQAFIVLLSPNSIESHNVIKEVSLASEKRKKILPLDLEPVTLPRELEYQLAGIHRAPLANIDSVIRALDKLGLEATQAPSIKLIKETDSRKTLMILPFDDLSPTADNQWFADGIVSEMISSLSNVKALRLIDAQTTKEFRNYKGHLATYAKEMGIRYFVQGDVRKFGDTIKITSRLLDIETGDHLWQDSLKGTMEDIFDIQETVAKNVVEGLNVILTSEEEAKLEKKPTENTEAYELYLKGNVYFQRHTRQDFERAISLYEEAIRLDPTFVDAHMAIANTSLAYFRSYAREAKWIDTATEHIAKAEATLGETAQVYWIRSILARTQRNLEDALSLINRAVELDPTFAAGFDTLAITSVLLGDREAAARARERQVELQENDRTAYFSYLTALNRLGDVPRLKTAARAALPIFERHLRLAPDDMYGQAQYAAVLCMAGDRDRALEQVRKLKAIDGLDSYTLFTLACVCLHGGENEQGFSVLQKAVSEGFRNIDLFRIQPDIDRVRKLPAYEALAKELETKMQHG
jgi:TolB-like protein